MIKNNKLAKKKVSIYKNKYFEYYDDVKDHTKGFKEDWWIYIHKMYNYSK